MDRHQLIDDFIDCVDPETQFWTPMDWEDSRILASAIDRCLKDKKFPAYEHLLCEMREALDVVGMLKGPVKFLVLGAMCLEACGEEGDFVNYLYESMVNLMGLVEA